MLSTCLDPIDTKNLAKLGHGLLSLLWNLGLSTAMAMMIRGKSEELCKVWQCTITSYHLTRVSDTSFVTEVRSSTLS
jgi:hypothetical protein